MDRLQIIISVFENHEDLDLEDQENRPDGFLEFNFSDPEIFLEHDIES